MKTSDPETEKKLLDVARGLYIEADQFKASPDIASGLRREADAIYKQYGKTHEEAVGPSIEEATALTADEIEESKKLQDIMQSILKADTPQEEEKPQGFFRSMLSF